MRRQLEMFGPSADQSEFVAWCGALEFVPTRSGDYGTTCMRCALRTSPEEGECISAPCTPDMREDGKCGYFIDKKS